MLRLLSLWICATFLTCALAQGTSTTATGPAPTPTPTPPPTQGPTESPSPPPTQPPHIPADYSYSENDVVCIRLMGNMTLYLEYTDINDQKVIKEPISLDDLAVVDVNGSSCGSTSSNLLLRFNVLENDTQFLNFSFQLQKSNNVWNNSGLTYSFNGSSLPNVTSNVTGDVLITSNGLFNGNVDENGYYMCNEAQNVTFNSHDYINAAIRFENLKVQAFMNGKFGSVSYDCANDQGNKIVPIAVGAALAGLVIVVLIAYLIGRLKSRRQNSYEPLS